MADKRCPNGHFIDESWDLCPYCPVEEGEPEIPIVRPTRSGVREEERRPTRSAPSSPSNPSSSASVARAEPVSDVVPVERTVAVQKSDPNGVVKRYVVGWLVGLSGTSRGEAFPVRIGRNVLGRDRRSDIVVNDDQASSHHADLVFRPEERRYILMDHNSTNGTYVNEGEIEPRRDLSSQDVIRIGSQRYLFIPLCRDGFYWDEEGALR